MKKQFEKYEEIIKNASLCDFDKTIELMQLLEEESEGNKAITLRYICEFIYNQENDDRNITEDPVLPEEEWINYISNFKVTINEIINSTVSVAYEKKMRENDFYNLLYKSLLENPLFDTINKKAYALFEIIQSRFIPFFQFDAEIISMSDEEFQKYLENDANSVIMMKIKNVLSSHLPQMTQKISLIFSEILKLQSKEEQVAILSCAFCMFANDFYRSKILAKTSDVFIKNTYLSDVDNSDDEDN